MATEMTPQERAEDVYYGLQVMNAPEHNLRAADNERDVQAIVTLITETRRAALLEAAEFLKLMPMLTKDNAIAVLTKLAQEG